jgi:hypothetical protein
VSRHLSKLFDSLCKLKFRLDASGKPLKFGLGMYSKEDEFVDFDKECDLSGQVSLGGAGLAACCHVVIHLSRRCLGASFYLMYQWRSEDNFRESVLSFHCVGPRDRAHVCQAWQQAPLPAEPSHRLQLCYRIYSTQPSRSVW